MSRSSDPSSSSSRPAKRLRTTSRSSSSSSSSSTSSIQSSSKRSKGKNKAIDQSLSPRSAGPESEGQDSERQESNEGEPDLGQGSDKEEDDDDDDDLREARRKAHSERIKKAWETRRANQALLENARAVERNGPATGSDSATPSTSTPIPTTDLLLSIHAHTSQFYTTHSLLFEPEKKARYNPWGSRKRLLLLRDSRGVASIVSRSRSARTGDGPTLTGAEADGPRSRDRTESQTRARRRSGDRNDEDEAQDELDEDNTSEDEDEAEESRLRTRIKVEPDQVDRHGELEIRKGRKNLPRKERRKGSYKIRDMYKAIEGEGLMALGILLQEHVVSQLIDAGYRPPPSSFEASRDGETSLEGTQNGEDDDDDERQSKEEDDHDHDNDSNNERKSDEEEKSADGSSGSSSEDHDSFVNHQSNARESTKTHQTQVKNAKRRPGFG
nr:uncharacterized protein CI109_002550 [Kwoniella shandongensis]KAA5529209.1 hypothetical protein CI109_002550 [Kwoniella shandongensis]